MPKANKLTEPKANKLTEPKISKTSTKVAPRKSISPADPDATIASFQEHYPDAHCALNFENPFQLLVATILSAQCTDVRVNKVTPELFRQFPTPEALSKAPLEKVEDLIKSTNFFRNKAKNLISCAVSLVERHGGQVPKELDSLVNLAGVGRKTGNVVLGNAYGIISGIVVDTHVARLSYRLGWTKSDNPIVIEKELAKLIPHEHWIVISHWLIEHGRQICSARKPLCGACFLFDRCPRVGVQ